MLSGLRIRQLLAAMVVFTLSFGVGYRLRVRSPLRAAPEPVAAVVDQSVSTAAAIAPAPVVTGFAGAVEKLQRSPAGSRIKLTGEGEEGADLWLIAALAHDPRAPTEESLYWESRALARLGADPARSLKELRRAWPSLQGDEYRLHRAAVMMLVSGVDGGADEFLPEAEAELRQPVDPIPADSPEDDRLSSRDQEAGPVAAHALLLKSSVSDERAIMATLEALRLQPAQFIRGALIQQFRNLRPQAWAELERRLDKESG